MYAARRLVNSRRSGYLLPKFLAARSVSLSGLSGSARSASENYVAWLGAYRFQFILQHLVENIGSRRIWSPASSSLRLADSRTFFSNTALPTHLSATIRLPCLRQQNRNALPRLQFLFEQAFVPSVLHFSVTTFPYSIASPPAHLDTRATRTVPTHSSFSTRAWEVFKERDLFQGPGSIACRVFFSTWEARK